MWPSARPPLREVGDANAGPYESEPPWIWPRLERGRTHSRISAGMSRASSVPFSVLQVLVRGFGASGRCGDQWQRSPGRIDTSPAESGVPTISTVPSAQTVSARAVVAYSLSTRTIRSASASAAEAASVPGGGAAVAELAAATGAVVFQAEGAEVRAAAGTLAPRRTSGAP